MIPDTIVEAVRARADLVELISEHVVLKRAGKDYKGLCPFHQEKTPSFYVVPSKGFYKCFGCGESGDLFSFVMKRTGLGFQDAVRYVARRVGVEIPEPGAAREVEERHRPLYEALAFAADFYHRQLWDEAGGERARRYLAARGIPEDVAKRFMLGYAPDDWRGVRGAAAAVGIEDAVLLEAGLIKESERAEEPYDRFRDRIMFPITDLGGRVIAFGGRTLERAREGVPKYLNSPETPLYQKGRVLYGLYWSKSAIRREGAALIVEGYMDYVTLAAHGFENVVAPLGTALTGEQAEILRRYTKQALLLYDSDTAGLRATFRSGDALLQAGVHPLVVTLPPGEDPDSLVRSDGGARLRALLSDAVDVLDRKLQILEERGYFDDVDRTRRAVDSLLPTLRAASDPTLRDIYVARVSERTGVRRSTLERELEGDAGALAPGRTKRGDRVASAAEAAERPAAAAVERLILLLMIQAPDRIPRVAEVVDPAAIEDPVNREVFEKLAAAGLFDRHDLSGLGLSPQGLARLEALLGDPEVLSDWDRVLSDTVSRLEANRLFARLDELDRELDFEVDEERGKALLQEYASAAQKLRSMGYRVSRRYRTYLERARRARPGLPAQEG